MKSNDSIPADEMLLAEAIAAAKARGMAWSHGSTFRRPGVGSTLRADLATECCALGGIVLAGAITVRTAVRLENGARHPARLTNVWRGNDSRHRWDSSADDRGESLGWAFRCAMEDQ